MILVTPHFAVAEFDCHDGTPYPEAWIEERLTPLCELMEVVRSHWGEPIITVSGYRTPAWNQRVGGARESRHLLGDGADFRPTRPTPDRVEKLHDLVLDLYDDGQLPRLGGLGLYLRWIHVDTRPRPAGRVARWQGKGVGSER